MLNLLKDRSEIDHTEQVNQAALAAKQVNVNEINASINYLEKDVDGQPRKTVSGPAAAKPRSFLPGRMRKNREAWKVDLHKVHAEVNQAMSNGLPSIYIY